MSCLVVKCFSTYPPDIRDKDDSTHCSYSRNSSARLSSLGKECSSIALSSVNSRTNYFPFQIKAPNRNSSSEYIPHWTESRFSKRDMIRFTVTLFTVAKMTRHASRGECTKYGLCKWFSLKREENLYMWYNMNEPCGC